MRPVEFEEAAFKMEHELLNYCSILPSTGGLGTLDNISFGTVCIARKRCRVQGGGGVQVRGRE